MTNLVKVAETQPPMQYTQAQIDAAAEFGLDVADYVEMMGEQALTRTMLPLWRFNGQDGFYVNKAIQPYNPENHPSELSGIILGVSYSQIWLRPYADPSKYSQSWLCLAGDKRRPPRVHEELTEEEKALVARLGAGQNCMTCPLAQWSGEKGENPPVCSDGVRLFFLTTSNEPILLAFSGTSGRQLDRFLGSTFKNARRPWNAFMVHFGRIRKTEPGKNYWESTFAAGEAVPKASMPALMEIRRQYVEHFEKARDQSIEDDYDRPHQAEPVEEPFDVGGELEFDADGNPVFTSAF